MMMKTTKSQFLLVAGILLVATLFTPVLRGQSVSGSITGQVTDPSGATIPEAEVKVVNTQTNVESTSKTNGAGYFNVPNLIAGSYRVEISAPGFAGVTNNDVQVTIGSVVRLDTKLTVGGETQRITVTGEAPLIQTDKVEVGTTINTRQLQALPTEGRNPTRLAATQAGVVMDNGNEGIPSSNGSAQYSFQVNGQRGQQNRQLLDGVDDTEGVGGSPAIVPSTDALQEYQLVTSNYDVELGQVAGAVQLFTTKAGTNQFHGTAHEFNRVNALFAANPFTEPKGPGHFVFNQFGGTVGGPIIKNKLFFFAYYDGYRVRSGGNALATVPIAAFRTGDFSSIAATNPIFDPTTGGANGVGRTQFSCNGVLNVICPDRLDPIAQALLAKLPLPNNGTGVDNNFVAPRINPLTQNAFTFRGDYTFNPTTQIFSRFTRQAGNQSSVVPAYGELVFPGSALSTGNQNSAVGNITHAFSPSLVVEGRFGWTLNEWKSDAPDQATPSSENFGIPGLNSACPDCGGLAGFQIGGPVGAFQFGNNTHAHQVDNYGNYNFVGIVTWTHRSHSFKFGSDTELAWRDRRDTSSQGEFGCANTGVCDGNGFSQNITGAAGVTDSGLGIASFLLGDASSFGRVIYATKLPLAHNTHYAFYGQDTWRVTPKLTLNLGLRWDYLGYPTSPQKGGIANFDFSNTNTLISDFGNTSSTANVEQNHNAWGPRVGFAYQVQKNTVVRAGYGRSYAIGFDGANFGAITNDWPNATRQNFRPTDLFQPAITLSQGPPAFISGFDILDAAGNPGAFPTPNSTAFGTNFHNPENSIDQWNFAVQHQFGNDLTVSAAYVGNAVRHLFYRFDANAVRPGPSNGLTINERRPYAAFDFFTNAYNQSNQSSTGYQGAQLQVQKRYSKGLTFTSAFSYGRSYDFGFHNANDPFATNLDRGPQDQDRRFVLVFSHVWELPFGKGRAFMNRGGVANAVLGGWQLSGIETLESGLPVNPVLGNSASLNSDCCTLRPDVIGDPKAAHQGRNSWYNSAAFGIPAPFVFGDAGRNSIRGPGFFGVDLSLSKTFKFTERIGFELQCEAFNAFNRTNLGQPNNTVDSSSAGVINSIAGTMRRLQLGGTVRF
jgi:Carboxypeptidase regulatory-like domain/TonB dependent receptor